MTILSPIKHLPASQTNEPTAMLAWAVVIAQTLEHAGIDSQSLFLEADIPWKLAVNPYMRVPTVKMNHLFKLAVEATQNPCFGLQMAQHIHPTTFHALGYSLFASATLQDYCERLVRFFKIVSDNCRHYIEEDHDKICLRIELLVPNLAWETQDGWTATLVKFIRSIYRPDFKPREIHLLRPALSGENEEQFTRYFQCPIHFQSDQWSLSFRKEEMYAPLPGGSHELALMNDRVVMDYLAQLERSNLTHIVRSHIIQLLPSGHCSKEAIAARLAMSSRTLQNKLELQNTSYQDILDQTRRDLAINYMNHRHIRITEVTYLLGFSDTGNFSRAFRRWTGKTPSQFREPEKPEGT
ncbi:Transcriptional regulator, AraC family [gamma proteobacterium HdN1]|nr:Transcriptional regulator, AraC family [gamma proteobacterium HdN1]